MSSKVEGETRDGRGSEHPSTEAAIKSLLSRHFRIVHVAFFTFPADREPLRLQHCRRSSQRDSGRKAARCPSCWPKFSCATQTIRCRSFTHFECSSDTAHRPPDRVPSTLPSLPLCSHLHSGHCSGRGGPCHCVARFCFGEAAWRSLFHRCLFVAF